jgi:soluble P-type ATPase
MFEVEIPGGAALHLQHLVVDINGTLTSRGVLIEGVRERLSAVGRILEVHLVSADTFGAAATVAVELGVESTRVTSGEDKVRLLEELGPGTCVAVGNGRNDEGMLRAAGLGIAVIGPEGTAFATLAAADIVCRSITEALDLLLDDRLLVATLRG